MLKSFDMVSITVHQNIDLKAILDHVSYEQE